MNKKLGIIIGTTILGASSIVAPMLTSANGFTNQRATSLGVTGGDRGGTGDEGFITFIQTAVNWILSLLGLISIIILIYGGFQMVTAAGDEGKYKKGFTIVKQAVIGLILIGASAMIINLVFSFMASNTTSGGGTGG